MSDLQDLTRALEVIARAWPDDSDASFIHGTLSDFMVRSDVAEKLSLDDQATYRPVDGYCPACGGTSLGQTSRTPKIWCFNLECPQPDAVHQLLAQTREEHEVEFTADGWTIKHPTVERIGDALFACPASRFVADLDRPEPGRYRLVRNMGDWSLGEVIR